MKIISKQPHGFQERILKDPASARKRSVVSVMSRALIFFSMLNLATIQLFADPGDTFLDTLAYADPLRIFVTTVATTLVSLGSLWLTSRSDVPAETPGSLVTVAVVASILVADDFIAIAGGRSTIFLTIPVVMAAVVVHPAAAFALAAVNTVILFLHPGGILRVNIYAIAAFWALAWIMWLATSIMEKAIQTAQKETERVRAMLGIVSHELRTPLGSVNGYVDILMMGDALEEMQRQMLSRVKTAALELTELVNRLLDKAHIQSGKITLRPAPTGMHELFDELIERTSAQAQEKGLAFTFEVESLSGRLLVDPIRIRQITNNLLGNAIKFTPEGSVHLAAKHEKQLLSIVVFDTGTGIPEKDIEGLFQEFAQEQNYATREYGGLGLGLSIVRDLVFTMGGEIEVNSVVGQGTTFTITIPVQIQE